MWLTQFDFVVHGKKHDTGQFMRNSAMEETWGTTSLFINHKGPLESRKPVDDITGGRSATSTLTLDIGTEVKDI